MSAPKLGTTLPDFTAAATDGLTINSAFLSARNTVLYFYPKDSTSGCTQEGEDFRDACADFGQAGWQIVGVSRDSLKSHENFKRNHAFPFALVSDTDEQLCRLFDVIKLKKLYGREYMGIDRSTFLISRERKLLAEWRGVKVNGHVAEVLEKCRSL